MRVERVVASARSLDGGAPQYLIKWEALPYASCTWEAALHLVDEIAAVARLHAAEARGRAPSGSGV